MHRLDGLMRRSRLAYDAEVLADLPDHYWKLDEAGPGVQSQLVLFEDFGTKRLHASLAAGTGYRLGAEGPAPWASALENDNPASGSSFTSFAQAPSLVMDGRTAWTVECWAFTTSFASSPSMFGTRSTSGFNRFTLFWRTTGRIRLIYYNTTPTARDTDDTGTALALNTWGHVAVTYDGSTVRRYLNGVPTGNNLAVAGDTIQAASGASGEGIGATTTQVGSETNLNGRICRVAVYPRALSADRIQAHYRAMFCG